MNPTALSPSLPETDGLDEIIEITDDMILEMIESAPQRLPPAPPSARARARADKPRRAESGRSRRRR
jgi:hypothetical protein